jgi:hypothetical protein
MLGLVGCATLAFWLGPMRVVEGLDVLLARNGRAPMPMAWLDFVRVSAEPPGYLREPDRRLLLGVESQVPEGTLLTIRGIPLREGRKLVLTDGKAEVPFVSDGSGGAVARWTVASSAELRIGARFGNVLIEDPESLSIGSVIDEAPRVEVEGAPKTVELSDLDRLEIRYAASDDHGLRQVDLVLRAGNREDRRVLSRLDGETKLETGGHALTARDPFLRRMFLPVAITVEARDADPLRGPKWESASYHAAGAAVGNGRLAIRCAGVGARRGRDFSAWQISDTRPSSTLPHGRGASACGARCGCHARSHRWELAAYDRRRHIFCSADAGVLEGAQACRVGHQKPRRNAVDVVCAARQSDAQAV